MNEKKLDDALFSAQMIARDSTMVGLSVTGLSSGSVIFEADAFVFPSVTRAALQASLDDTVDEGYVTVGQTTFVFDPQDATVSGKIATIQILNIFFIIVCVDFFAIQI